MGTFLKYDIFTDFVLLVHNTENFINCLQIDMVSIFLKLDKF